MNAIIMDQTQTKTKPCSKEETNTHINNDNRRETRVHKKEVPKYGTQFGHSKSTKKTSMIWVLSQNINGIPHDKDTEKSQEIKHFLGQLEINSVILWQEIKLYWPQVPYDSKWSLQHSQPLFYEVLSYNEHEPTLTTPMQ